MADTPALMSHAARIQDAILVRHVPIISREPGNSMTPILKSRQPCLLSPIDRALKKGDIVFAKVKGNWYTHRILQVGDDGRVLIGNNHGHENGWTSRVVALARPLTEAEVKYAKECGVESA